MTTQTDFVILWVDGSDPAWRRAFAEARGRADADADASEIRYRDWRNLRYWFRAVERFAPWVRRIHFITWGHLPEWLATEHPRLHVVRHEEYIPREYLPTFNSNTIELCIPRIEGLAERFVLFNDDMFLTRPCPEETFFRRGLPCDTARLSVVRPSSVGHIVLNDLELVNARWNARAVLRRHPGKWFSPRYGLGEVMKTASLAVWSFFPGLRDTHMPQPYLTAHFREAWERWGEALDASCRHTFRQPTDLSHWLVRYDTLCRGEFSPRGFGDCRLMTLDDRSIDAVCRDVAAGRWRMVCLNDSTEIADFDRSCRRLCDAFERLLPEKSSYER